MKIRELLERVSYRCLQGSLDQEITGYSHDNRQVEEGDMFICIKGARFDTHQCVEEVAAKGARMIVAERAVRTANGIEVI